MATTNTHTEGRRWFAGESGLSTNPGIGSSQLFTLFMSQLEETLWTEKSLLKATTKMINNATSRNLYEALQDHFTETKEHISRLERAFSLLDEKPATKKNGVVACLIADAEHLMEVCEQGPMCDAGIISIAQKIEHYEIASYTTLSAYAIALDRDDIADLFDVTLDEEKLADARLCDITSAEVNVDTVQSIADDAE